MHRTVPVIVAILVSVAMVGWLLVTAPDTPAPDQRPDGSVFTPRAGAVDDARVNGRLSTNRARGSPTAARTNSTATRP